MRILILGATGRTGRFLVEETLKRGFNINVLVRDKNKIDASSNLISVFEGIPTDKEALTNAMRGCDSVMSALNISRTSDFPWAKLRTPKSFLSDTMKNIIEATKKVSLERIIITTAWGVAETKKDVPAWFRWLIDHSNIGYPYRDHELQEELLKNSTLNWTIVRPVGLTNSLKEKCIIVTVDNSPKPTLTIGRQSVARFMINALQNNLYLKESPTISEK
ncbi:MAG TPA: NAD(P)-binding oxidoreductase [Mucilaginibacter sp.]|jgi:putative NADH-flavin reductase